MLVTTGLTTAIWLTVTLVTRAETEATLQAFYNRVRPAALGWRRFAEAAVDPSDPDSAAALTDPSLRYNFLHWILGFTLVYAMLFGVGDLLFGRTSGALGLIALSVVTFAVLFWSLNRRGWSVWR